MKGTFHDERFGIFATRVYVVVLTVSIIILTFYSSLTVHNLSFTVMKPSLATFERLQKAYSFSLSCPCSQVAIPQGNMFTSSPVRYHQVRIVILQKTYLHFLSIQILNEQFHPNETSKRVFQWKIKWKCKVLLICCESFEIFVNTRSEISHVS